MLEKERLGMGITDNMTPTWKTGSAWKIVTASSKLLDRSRSRTQSRFRTQSRSRMRSRSSPLLTKFTTFQVRLMEEDLRTCSRAQGVSLYRLRAAKLIGLPKDTPKGSRITRLYVGKFNLPVRNACQATALEVRV